MKGHLALLIDFGASRIKSATVDLQSGRFSNAKSQPSLPNIIQEGEISKGSLRYEVSAESLREAFLSLCRYYLEDLKLPIQQILLCSEMHGFLVIDGKTQRPLSNYISWKDSRSNEGEKGETAFDLISSDWSEIYKGITGMRLRSSLPFVNFFHLAKNNSLPQQCKLLSLPEWLAHCANQESGIQTTPFVHETMLAGCGLYNIYKKQPSLELCEYVHDHTGIQVSTNFGTDEIKLAAQFKLNGAHIPIYVAVGDHQCAVLGAGNSRGETISVNIGTGSQVALIDFPSKNDKAELRPYFNGSRLTTITHIPAGRVLNHFIGFLSDVAKASGASNPDFWPFLAKCSSEDILKSKLNMNLSLFPGSWNYSLGGSISEIQENNFNLMSYLASLIKSLALQYCEVIQMLDPQKKTPTILLSGGVAQKLPQLRDILSKITGLQTRSAISFDETLLGLRTLALHVSQPGLGLAEAQSYFKTQPEFSDSISRDFETT